MPTHHEPAGHSALEIANEFIELSLRQGIPVTQLQLQKLTYLAHGYNLALNREPLVIDRVEAWDYGTVFRVLYDSLKHYGRQPVDRTIRWGDDDTSSREGKVAKASLTDAERQIIEDVWRLYGKFPAFQLSALTHDPDGPWKKYYKDGASRVIPDSEIREYFSSLIEAERGRSKAITR